MDKNHNQEMYQASDGKWYPKAQMPQNWQGQQQQSYGQPYGQQQQYYGQQQMGYGGQHQPQQVYVQQRPGGGAGAGAGAGLAACCGALLCFNLGACMF